MSQYTGQTIFFGSRAPGRSQCQYFWKEVERFSLSSFWRSKFNSVSPTIPCMYLLCTYHSKSCMNKPNPSNWEDSWIRRKYWNWNCRLLFDPELELWVWLKETTLGLFRRGVIRLMKREKVGGVDWMGFRVRIHSVSQILLTISTWRKLYYENEIPEPDLSGDLIS